MNVFAPDDLSCPAFARNTCHLLADAKAFAAPLLWARELLMAQIVRAA